MATEADVLHWMDYQKRYNRLFDYGMEHGLIHRYEQDLINSLGQVYYGCLPASIVLLHEKLCAGSCYEMGLLITFGFGDDDFRIVEADIDGITLNPQFIGSANEHYGNHRFAERTKADGTTWVYDTSMGLVYEKDLFYQMENPQITKTYTKAETIALEEYQMIKSVDPDEHKSLLPRILPKIAATAVNQLYTDELLTEITRFKKSIGYDETYLQSTQETVTLLFKPN